MAKSLITSEQMKDLVSRGEKAGRRGVKRAVSKFSKALDRSAVQRIQADGKLNSAIEDAMEKFFAESIELKTSHLTCISLGKDTVLDPTDGTETIANAKDVFPDYIDSDFKNWGLDVPAEATKRVKTHVFEMTQDGDFKAIFGSFGENLDRLCLTQAQIKQFCKKHAKWLRTDGYGTFFLFKVGKDYFVADVDVYSDGLYVHVFRLSYDYVWDAGYRPRVVVPQL